MTFLNNLRCLHRISAGSLRRLSTDQSFDGKALPLVSVNLNLGKPAVATPVLLTWDNAGVLFHELGHALRALLADVDYPSLGITTVVRNWIELPSQSN